MSRPSKPLALVKGHRTQAEKEIRKQAEESLLTGRAMAEWKTVKDDAIAHRHFLRISKLFKTIDKNDALHESVINRYCSILAECERFGEEDLRLRLLIDKLDDNQDRMEFVDYVKALMELNKQIQKNASLLQTKRKMLLDIEKENIMTIASQLRSIPKKPTEEGTDDPMARLLGG